MKPAIGYRRVSTETQLDGFGLDIQDDALTETATAEGYTLVATFTDEGECGAETIDVRIELGRALDYLAEHPGTALIIPRLDRLARDLIVQEQLLADAWRTGAEVVSCSPTERMYCQPDNPDDPARTLIRQVLGAVAAYERRMIRLRLRSGRRRKLDAAGYAGGPTPYGWVCRDEQALLDDVDTARAAGMTWRAIARRLNADGRFKRNGTPWSHSDLHRTHTRARLRPAG